MKIFIITEARNYYYDFNYHYIVCAKDEDTAFFLVMEADDRIDPDKSEIYEEPGYWAIKDEDFYREPLDHIISGRSWYSD